MNILNKILDFNDIDKDNIKVKLMREDAFAFFRGTSHLFFEHLDTIMNPRLVNNPHLLCWIQGDAHIGNLGFSNKTCSTFKDIRFDINDFDESYIGNPFLDIIRFGVSIGFFFDSLNNEYKEELRDIDIVYKDTEVIEYFLQQYFKYATKDKYVKYNWSKSPFMKSMAKKAQKRVNTKHPKSRINKFTKIVDKKRVFDFESGRIEKLENSKALKNELIKKGFDVKEICKRISAGVGSAHLDRYYFIADIEGEELLFEVKEQLNPSFLASFEQFQNLSHYEYASKIHIFAKQKMLKDYDMHLESLDFDNKDFLIKSIFNAKYSIDASKFIGADIYEFESNLKDYIKFCAISLSNAHKISKLDNNFIPAMKKIYKNRFYEIQTLILKSYATNISMYSHFVRDLQLQNEKKTEVK